MLFRKFKNNEELSFCNVDTPEEALTLMMEPNTTDYDEIMKKMVPTIYGFQAVTGKKPYDTEYDKIMKKIVPKIYGFQEVGKKPDKPGNIWEIKGFANADDKVPTKIRKINHPSFDQLPKPCQHAFSRIRDHTNPCPICKKALEIACIDVNLNRNSMRIELICSDNACPFHKIRDLNFQRVAFEKVKQWTDSYIFNHGYSTRRGALRICVDEPYNVILDFYPQEDDPFPDKTKTSAVFADIQPDGTITVRNKEVCDYDSFADVVTKHAAKIAEKKKLIS